MALKADSRAYNERQMSIVENHLKWVVITSGHNNENYGDENSKKIFVLEKKIEIINNNFFHCLSLSILGLALIVDFSNFQFYYFFSGFSLFELLVLMLKFSKVQHKPAHLET